MKEYLLLYRNGDPSWMDRPPEETREIMVQWNEWFRQLESGGHLRNPGAALAPGGAVLRRNGDGIATDTTLSEVKELVGGFTLVQASSLEEATRLGGSITIPPQQPEGRHHGAARARDGRPVTMSGRTATSQRRSGRPDRSS